MPGVPDVSVRSGRGPVEVRTAVVAWFGAWVAAQVLTALAVVVTGEEPGGVPDSMQTLATVLVASWAAYLAMLWVVSDRAGSGHVRDDYAVDGRLRDLAAAPVGVLTQLVVVPAVYVPLRAIWPATFDPDRLEERTRDLIDVADGSSALVLVGLVVVGAPLVEELVYRGLLQRSFAARINDGLALVAASLWFAVIHFRLLELPGLFVAGLVFGGCLLVTGRLATAVIAHAAFNATALAAAWPTTAWAGG